METEHWSAELPWRPATLAKFQGVGWVRIFIILSLFILMLKGFACASPVLVIYGSPAQKQETMDQRYPLQLLREALAASGEYFALRPSGRDMVQSRVLKEIAAGSIDVYWSMTSAAREQQLRPIRIPLDKGLNGWRLLLVRKAQQHQFSAVRTLQQLKKITFIQGHDWPDTQILQHNGLQVLTSAHPPQLYDMLKKQRGDVFPRAVFEAYYDVAREPATFAVESDVVLVYPSAVYFFVHPANQRLAQAIERGLTTLINNGRFEQLFMQRYGRAIKQARLAQRQQIHLFNPLLPSGLPPADSPLWYRPAVPEQP